MTTPKLLIVWRYFTTNQYGPSLVDTMPRHSFNPQVPGSNPGGVTSQTQLRTRIGHRSPYRNSTGRFCHAREGGVLLKRGIKCCISLPQNRRSESSDQTARLLPFRLASVSRAWAAIGHERTCTLSRAHSFVKRGHWEVIQS